MDKHEIELHFRNGEPILIVTGPFENEHAFVTWWDDKFVRVTPIHGDPLLSLELTYEEIE